MIECFKKLRFTQKIFFILFLPITLITFLFVFTLNEFICACRTFDRMMNIMIGGYLKDD